LEGRAVRGPLRVHHSKSTGVFAAGMPVFMTTLQTTPGDAGLEHDRTLSQIARGLTWVGAAFLIASAAVIVWAVFRTVGVDDLVVALTVAGLGLGLPAIVAFVVAWILNSLGHPDTEAAEQQVGEPVPPAPRAQLAGVAWGYAVAVLACIGAWAVRAALDPFLGHQVAYAPLLLAVAFAAWYGGLGPAVFATLLGGAISWYAYLLPSGRFGALDGEDSVQLGLYGAAALCIGGIASALRASRERAHTLAREVLAREAGLEKTRAELATERDRSQVTLQAIADAVIATDAQGHVSFCNEGAAKLTGWPTAEAMGKPLSKIFRTIDADSRRPVPVQLDRGVPETSADVVLVARDGTERRVETKVSAIRERGGAAGGFVLVFRDITSARHAQAALEESEARFRLMANQTPMLLWMCDKSCACVYVNSSWLEFTGRTLEEETGDGWTTGIHPEDFGPRQAAFAEAFERRQPFRLEYRLRRHDGEYRWILDDGAPRFDGAGEFAGYIGACVDITERRLAEATLGSFEQRKGAFLASLAHELRNPLAPIRSSIELLQRIPAGGDPRAARAHEIIERQCARLAELVDDLLDLSRIDSGNIQLKRERIDIAPLVERAVARHAAVIRDRRQRIDVDIARERMRVEADPDRLTQIVGILVGNASKFTPQGGELRVTARACEREAEIVVADTGPGIEPSVQSRVFDLFDRYTDMASDAPQSLGTGLAIVARLARLMGGTVGVQSAGTGQGSAFTVRMPLADPAGESVSLPGTRGEASSRRARLLVVDDNVDAADAMGTLLNLNGFDVELAHDPESAMERAIATDPDVVLLDIGLPGMTGYELARMFGAHPVVSRAKLIALTGYGQPGDTEQAKAAGFAGYLVKPVDVDELRERIDAILAAETGVRSSS
jgi:PAS domain S-box-containing protein